MLCTEKSVASGSVIATLKPRNLAQPNPCGFKLLILISNERLPQGAENLTFKTEQHVSSFQICLGQILLLNLSLKDVFESSRHE